MSALARRACAGRSTSRIRRHRSLRRRSAPRASRTPRGCAARAPASSIDIELLLGIVQVVEIDRLDAEVDAAARDLIGEKGRGEAVSAGDDLFGAHDPRLEILALHVLLIFLALAGCVPSSGM